MLRLIPAGRLGNQLIQYVAVRAQAKRMGVDLEIDPLYFDRNRSADSYTFWLETLPIRARIIRYSSSGPLAAHGLAQRAYRKLVQPLFWHRYRQPLWAEDERFFHIRPRTIVSGHFQSLFYLLPRDEEIMAEVDLWKAAPPQAVAHARAIAEGGFVSVHVRRGDTVFQQNEAKTLPIWQPDYLAYVGAAMDLIRSKIGRCRFLVFSDDIEWCKQAGVFGRDCEFLETNQYGENPAIDLLFMSVCSHHIVANSSYSWWAAWAVPNDEKICVLPKNWTRQDTTQALGLLHPTWIAL